MWWIEEGDTDEVRWDVLSNAVERWYGLSFVDSSFDQSGSTELDDSLGLLSLDSLNSLDKV